MFPAPAAKVKFSPQVRPPVSYNGAAFSDTDRNGDCQTTVVPVRRERRPKPLESKRMAMALTPVRRAAGVVPVRRRLPDLAARSLRPRANSA